MKFRSQPLNQLSASDLDNLLYQKTVFERRWSKKRQYPYKPTKRSGKKLVVDKTTKLTWQQSGSPSAVTYADAEKYIRELNKQKFANYKDWRLPTVDEAMSLLIPCKDDNDLYIDLEFDRAQPWIWTDEEASDGTAWVMTFQTGYCYVPVDTNYYVRAVRGEFWYPEDDSVDLSQIYGFDYKILADLL
jgi:hypothetical protein